MKYRQRLDYDSTRVRQGIAPTERFALIKAQPAFALPTATYGYVGDPMARGKENDKRLS